MASIALDDASILSHRANVGVDGIFGNDRCDLLLCYQTYYSKPITCSKMRASLAKSAGLLNQRESYCKLYLIRKLVVFCVLTCDFRNRVRLIFRAAELAKAVKDDN
jgi:hypothetical protein